MSTAATREESAVGTIASTMKAVRIHAWGGPEALTFEDAPRPEPAPGEVLVRVRAAGVNPVDWKTRKGEGVAGLLAQPFPVVLGWDLAGEVEAAGPGVHRFAPGADVFGMIRFPRAGAAYAEYATAHASELAPMPAILDHEQAAAVPLAALTAWQALFEAADLRRGQIVLIHAAAGGVGHLAVQLAKWRGARVVGTTSARNAEFVRGLGADDVIDYRAQAFDETVRGVDIVLDTIGGEVQERSWATLQPGGVLVSIVSEPPSEVAASHAGRGVWTFVRPDGCQLAEIGRLIDQGVIRPNVESVIPLAEAPRAHALSEGGHVRGKLVLRVAR